MLQVPSLRGLIRRRLLINFRVDAAAMAAFLPAPFRPKLHRGHAIAGICLIRLEDIRPSWSPRIFGLTSENAAHRIAVVWEDADGATREGVYIPRRDTSSRLNHLVGGRLFPGEHHLANFTCQEKESHLAMRIRSRDRTMAVDLEARETDTFPTSSCFENLAESSAFFEAGSIGYSVTRDCCRFDGIRLETLEWKAGPLHMESIHSSFFDEQPEVFPPGTIQFDHALIMRNLPHRWHGEPALKTDP